MDDEVEDGGLLPGHDLPWREWLAGVEPTFDIEGLSPEHVKLWEWEEALVPGSKPPAFLADWPRGYGKTSTLRLLTLRLCVTKRRRFILMVSSLQESANRSVDALRDYFARQGIERLTDQYGASLGWRASTLRTKCGFTVVAVGLDVASVRGINIQGQRPDGIFPDDIDRLDETVESTEKNYRVLTQTVIPAGSTDAAVLFVQNEIHANSVMARLVSGEADALRYRTVSKTVAVERMELGRRPNPIVGEPDLYTIASGRSTWPGRPLSYWEALINESGEAAFRREMQHELGAGGLFFSAFQAERLDTLTGELTAWHVCPMPKVAAWDMFHASHDYGTTAPACSLIALADQWGVFTIVGEVYGADRTSKQQALHLLHRLSLAGICSAPPAVLDASVPGGIRATDADKAEQAVRFATRYDGQRRLRMVAFDYANTFTPKTGNGGAIGRMIGEYPAEVWHRYGIPVVAADKNIIAGFRSLRDALTETVTLPADHPTQPGQVVPRLRIAQGAAPNFQAYLETALTDPHDERVAVSKPSLEHCLVAETLITTRRGAVPIVDVVAGDYVLTRSGWRQVLKSWRTGQGQPVYRVSFSDGRHIVATSKHPVFVDGRGFVTVDALRYADGVRIASLSNDRRSGVYVHHKAPSGIADVYNLTVEGVPEFYANGVLVHNSGDSGRYLCMTRPKASPPPPPEQFKLPPQLRSDKPEQVQHLR